MDPPLSTTPVVGSQKRKLSIPANNFSNKKAAIDPRLQYNVTDEAYGTSVFGNTREKTLKATGRTGQSCTNNMDGTSPVVFNINIPPGHMGVPNTPHTIMVEYQTFYTKEAEGSIAFYEHNNWTPLKQSDGTHCEHLLVQPNPLTFVNDFFDEVNINVDGSNIINAYPWDTRGKANYVTRTICSKKLRKQRLGILPYDPNKTEYKFQFHSESAQRNEARTEDSVTNYDYLSYDEQRLDTLLITKSARDTRKIYGNLECTPFLGNPYCPSMVTLEKAKRGLEPENFQLNFIPEETHIQIELSLASQLDIGRRLKRNTIPHKEYFSSDPYDYPVISADERKLTYKVVIKNVEIFYKVIAIPPNILPSLRTPNLSFNYLFDFPKLTTYTIESALNETDATFRIPPYAVAAYVVCIHLLYSLLTYPNYNLHFRPFGTLINVYLIPTKGST